MSKIIKCNEVPGGYLRGVYKENVAEQNLNPKFDAKEKAWKLKKVLKTDTSVIPWLIEYNNNFYVAKQFFQNRLGETVSIFNSTSKGKITNAKPVHEARGYVDIETVVDLFVDKLLRETHPANIDGSEEFNLANQSFEISGK